MRLSLRNILLVSSLAIFSPGIFAEDSTTAVSGDSETSSGVEGTETTTIAAATEVEVEPVTTTASENLVVKDVTEAPKKICGKNFTDAFGLFSTDNFPSHYESETNCAWNITAPEGQVVEITFHLLNIEHNNRCTYDYVKVFDTNGTLIKHVCGSLSQDLVVNSTKNSIRVEFFSDSVITNRGFLASWRFLPESQVNTVGSRIQSYELSFPQSFAVSKEKVEEKVCLKLNNVDEDGDISVSLLSTKSILEGEPVSEVKFNHKSKDSTIQCQSLGLPGDFDSEFAIVRIKADFPTINYKILSFKSISAIKESPNILIQTDKSEYRPKQDVYIRTFIFDSHLKPSKIPTISNVWVEEPGEIRIAQFKDVPLNQGIGQVSTKLSDEPALGEYKIKVELESGETHEATFTVAESVLPKFEVTVEGPSTILRDSADEKFKVCAKYTHESNVKGKANITFQSSHSISPWAIAEITSIPKGVLDLNEGCVDVVLTQDDISKLANKTSDLKAHISVEEAVTGDIQNQSWSGSVVFLPFKLDFEESSNQYIVGKFPYVGILKAVDHSGKPKENVKIELCARLFGDLDEMRNYLSSNSYKFYGYDEDQIIELSEKLREIKLEEICYKYTTNADGLVEFAILLEDSPFTQNASSLNFNAKAIDVVENEETHMKQPSAKLGVSLTRTDTPVSLTIHGVEKSSIECGENSVVVYYTAKTGDSFHINYILTSGAAIIASGDEVLTAGGEDKSKEYLGDANVLKFKTGEATNASGEESILSKFSIPIKRPFADESGVTSMIKLIVYVRTSDGKTLSLTKDYETVACDASTTIEWSAEKLHPGDPVKLTLKSTPGAYCGYSVVDKSVDLLDNPNKVTEPKLSKLKEDIASKRLNRESEPSSRCNDANLLYSAFERVGLFLLSDSLAQDTKCNQLTDATNLPEHRDFIDDIIPQPVFFSTRIAAAPSTTPFALASQSALESSDFAQDSSFSHEVRFKGGSSEEASVSKPTVELRNYFPETWLFDLEELNENGEKILEKYTPHTITTWIAEAICSDSVHGLTASKKASFLVSQDFFADILLPYSVKRGEILPLNVSVFNTVDQKLPMRVTVLDSEQYKVDGPKKTICLNEKDSKIETYQVTAKDLNEVNITVEAAIDSASSPDCGSPGSADGYKDTLVKQIQVKPEGYPVEKVDSEFICRVGENATADETIKMQSLKLPDNLVEGSARAWVSVTGDVLAPALSNLENLVTLPTGCGEQNMITLVPNIYLMEYLTGTAKSEPKLEEQAKKHMRLGYSRQNEKYRHGDGSYSIWGPSSSGENVGSIWLTTFVVKAFSQASKYIDIDTRALQKSIDWILEKQSRKSGCFEPVGQFIHSSVAGPEQSLTASVLVALLEVKASGLDVTLDPAFIDTAIRCIADHQTNTSDIYTKSLIAYALNLHNKVKPKLNEFGRLKKEFQRRDSESGVDTKALGKELVEDLLKLANVTIEGKLFWLTDDQSLSRAVEITAYNTMSLIMLDKLPESLKAIKWMSSNRNSRGGFVSTQDTMVAIQALTKYSLKINREQNALTLNAIFGDEKYPFELNEDNQILLQRQKLQSLKPDGDNEISFGVSGKGCFMVQTVLRYNVKDSPDTTSFALTVEQKDNKLKLCASYTGDKEVTDMVVIEAELLSGFVPYTSSLEALLNEVNDPIVKKYEVDEKENKFVLYFDGMSKKQSCWEIEVKQEIKIEDLKPAIVKIYDYYNTDDVFSTEYSI